MAGTQHLRYGFLANHQILLRRLDTEALLPYFISRGLITPEQEELIKREPTGSDKADRFLIILHRRASVDREVYDELLALLSDKTVAAGQVLDDVLRKIEEDSRDPKVQARFDDDSKTGNVSLRTPEDTVTQALIVSEVLPQLVSYGVVTCEENDIIRSKPSEVERAKELWKTITLKGNEAFDKFVEVLLQSGTQASLGELLKKDRNAQDQNTLQSQSQVPDTKCLTVLLGDLEEKGMKLFSEIALKYYKMGYEAGIHAATNAPKKAVAYAAPLYAAGPPPPPSLEDYQSNINAMGIAEKLKSMTDELDKDIEQETRKAFRELFRDISPLSISMDKFRDTCSRILKQRHKVFTTGWQQISVVYYAMFLVVVAIREEAGDTSTALNEQQVANFAGPTLVELGLYEWVKKHGGMENFGSPVTGEALTAVVGESSDFV